jgi:hypothetical protein
MKENYVTLFDSTFMPQGLALYFSMQRHCDEFVLWIICVDDDTYQTLIELNLENVKLLKLSCIENEDLRKVKSSRDRREYCWTLSPFAPRFVFERDLNISRVTYVDADLWFRRSPKIIFSEFESSDKKVMITDHGYSPRHDYSAVSGQFCVQFMIFKRQAEEIRSWWEAKCLEWCYCRGEDGKFGDQKYIELWPILFEDSVHVLRNKELTLAPWNAMRFPYGNSVFYHFQGLRIVSKKTINLGPYAIPPPLYSYVYKPYFQDLKLAINKIENQGGVLIAQARKINGFKKIFLKARGIISFISTNIPKWDDQW